MRRRQRWADGPPRDPWLTPRRARIGLVAIMVAILGLVGGGTFDRTEWSLVVVAPLVTIGALLVAGRRWFIRLAVALVAIAASVATAGVLAGGTLGDAATGVVEGPRRLITTEWPSPSDPGVIASVALLLAVVAALAADLAGRERSHLAPLLPIAAGLAALLALGAPLQPSGTTLICLSATAAAMSLLPHGELVPTRARTLVGDRTLVVSTVAIVAVAVVATSALAWADRASPRRPEEAQLTAALLDPIEAMVALRQAEPPFDLVRVTDRSTLIGQSPPGRWRIAALDVYDGQRWVPQITMRPIGGRLGDPSPPAPDRPPPIRYDVDYLTDDVELVPFPGRPLSVDGDVETDLERVAVRLAERPAPGTTVQAVSEIAPTSGFAQNATFAGRQVDEIAGAFTELAVNLGGEGNVYEQLGRIEDRMRTEWQLDESAPGAGQQLALIERFMTDTRRGTEEQFVTAFVLLVRSLGFDARVATGFVVPPEQLASPLALNSSQAAVWPEVLLDGVGWLAYDPAPASESTEDDAPTPPPEAQSPAAAQPPIAPPAEDAGDDDEIIIERNEADGGWATVGAWATRIGIGASITLLPVLVLCAAIVVAKLLRRRRRLQAGDAAVRVRGAWANATDSLVDAGLSIAPAWTDDRIARQAVPLAPGAPHEMRRLAAMSTAMTFGATDDGSRLADDAALTSDAIDDAIRSERTRWQRLRWRLSLRSLRRRTRSPVSV
ncbi:MAG: transglutaminase-like domain-containing protein [Ilumatobacter sp.]|uniref:transglutaminase-like domain-containing protein n=1 Tax=Ilumatobacter sp. TaxID=1967498 RepID=UPI002629C50C|nr:transglutaminase-like domain-containing protein [Ilumatobacter sp.]MDJ0768198.1 transglutaminase-like domain-containing protein [Ilumatobacter sp.]